MEGARDILGQPLDDPFLALPGVLIAESRQEVFLMQFVELRGFLRRVRQQLRHFVLHVDPARRQPVHLDHGIAVILQRAGLGYQPSALLGLVGEAIGWAEITWLLGWVVGERLAVGDVSGSRQGVLELDYVEEPEQRTYRLVRSRHMV